MPDDSLTCVRPIDGFLVHPLQHEGRVSWDFLSRFLSRFLAGGKASASACSGVTCNRVLACVVGQGAPTTRGAGRCCLSKSEHELADIAVIDDLTGQHSELLISPVHNRKRKAAEELMFGSVRAEVKGLMHLLMSVA